MQIVSSGNNLHEMSKPIFCKKKKKIGKKNNKLSSAEYAHRAVKVNDAMNNGTQGYSPNEKIDTDKLLAHSDPNIDQISISWFYEYHLIIKRECTILYILLGYM